VATGLTTRRGNTFVLKPSGYEFSRLEKYWAVFFIPAWFVLPYITRAGCYRALPAWKHVWHVNYQQCRLMCSFTSQSWDLPNVHTWMICISVTTSDGLREISDVWCFGSKSYVDWADVFSPISYPFRMKIIRFIIFKFLSSISHPHVCLVIVSNWRSSLPNIGNNITSYAYNRVFYIMMILRSVWDSTWVIVLC